MKIIGHSGSDLVLCEMSRDEVARIMGQRYESSLPNNGYGRHEKLPVGMIVEVSQVYFRLLDQQAAASQLNTAADTLESLAALCRITVPTVDVLGGAK